MKLRQRISLIVITTIVITLSVYFYYIYFRAIYSREADNDEIMKVKYVTQVIVRKNTQRSAKPNFTTLNEIGVVATSEYGKWDGEFTCSDVGNRQIKVIQATDYERLGKSDVLFLLHNADFSWEDIISHRKQGQIWIFVCFESPFHTGHHFTSSTRSAINWTLTYRTDSTFPSPYGLYLPGRPSFPINKNHSWAQNKTGIVAALVSNCDTSWPRMKCMEDLSAFMKVDIYGECGSMSCPVKTCNAIISRYKFYLAFENSQCTDYITEKFWHNAFNNNVVPVVYGASLTEYKRVAPPDSYIHVKNFTSLKHLADYLTLLDNNDEMYNQYFEWKRNGSVITNFLASHYEPNITMCRIFKKMVGLEEGAFHRNKNVDMGNWWENACVGTE